MGNLYNGQIVNSYSQMCYMFLLQTESSPGDMPSLLHFGYGSFFTLLPFKATAELKSMSVINDYSFTRIISATMPMNSNICVWVHFLYFTDFFFSESVLFYYGRNLLDWIFLVALRLELHYSFSHFHSIFIFCLTL